jgi:hypothetical protein
MNAPAGLRGSLGCKVLAGRRSAIGLSVLILALRVPDVSVCNLELSVLILALRVPDVSVCSSWSSVLILALWVPDVSVCGWSYVVRTSDPYGS